MLVKIYRNTWATMPLWNVTEEPDDPYGDLRWLCRDEIWRDDVELHQLDEANPPPYPIPEGYINLWEFNSSRWAIAVLKKLDPRMKEVVECRELDDHGKPCVLFFRN